MRAAVGSGGTAPAAPSLADQAGSGWQQQLKPLRLIHSSLTIPLPNACEAAVHPLAEHPLGAGTPLSPLRRGFWPAHVSGAAPFRSALTVSSQIRNHGCLRVQRADAGDGQEDGQQPAGDGRRLLLGGARDSSCAADARAACLQPGVQPVFCPLQLSDLATAYNPLEAKGDPNSRSDRGSIAALFGRRHPPQYAGLRTCPCAQQQSCWALTGRNLCVAVA